MEIGPLVLLWGLTSFTCSGNVRMSGLARVHARPGRPTISWWAGPLHLLPNWFSVPDPQPLVPRSLPGWSRFGETVSMTAGSRSLFRLNVCTRHGDAARRCAQQHPQHPLDDLRLDCCKSASGRSTEDHPLSACDVRTPDWLSACDVRTPDWPLAGPIQFCGYRHD